MGQPVVDILDWAAATLNAEAKQEFDEAYARKEAHKNRHIAAGNIIMVDKEGCSIWKDKPSVEEFKDDTYTFYLLKYVKENNLFYVNQWVPDYEIPA